MANFHQLYDQEIFGWTVKARVGGNDESKKIRNQCESKSFQNLRALPPSLSTKVPSLLKQRVGLDYQAFDELYNKLRTLEMM
ncbi:hypothetical protein Tco_0243349 [Tanacetum coccineum]